MKPGEINTYRRIRYKPSLKERIMIILGSIRAGNDAPELVAELRKLKVK